MRKLIFLTGLLILISLPAAAQTTPTLPRAEAFGGYNYIGTNSSNGDSSTYNGFKADVAIYPGSWFGLVAEVGRSTASSFKDSTGTRNVSSSSLIPYLFGPRFRFGTGRFTPFIDTLIGGVNRSNLVGSNGAILVGAQKSVGVYAGGGVDVKLNSYVGLRLVNVGLLSTWFSPGAGIHNSQDDLSVSTGIVFRWD